MLYHVGDRFHEDYTVIRVFGGEGSTGESEVYVIENNQTKQRLIAKTAQMKFGVWQRLLNLQMEELATRLLSDHPNFVKCYGLKLAQDAPWLILEYVDGVTLSDRLKAGGYRFTAVVDWWLQIVDAIGHIRRMGQIQMDVSADNILVTPRNRIKLIDLGRLQNAKLLALYRSSPELCSEAKSGEYTDLEAFGEIVQRSYNLCLVEELKRKINPNVDQSVLATWEAGSKHMAEFYETFYKMTGATGVMTSPGAPERMASLGHEILGLITMLRTSGRENQKVDYDEIRRKFDGIHRKVGAHDDCAVEELSSRLQADGHMLQGSEYVRAGRIEEALQCVDKAIATRADYAVAWGCKGDVLRLAGNIEESGRCYEHSLELDPNDVRVLVNYGTALVHEGKCQRGEELLLRALQIAPSNRVLLNNLGFLYEEMGELETAATYYSRAIEVDPNYEKAKQNLEIVKEKRKR